MSACPSCGAEGVQMGARCPKCGKPALPTLELDLRPPTVPKAKAKPKAAQSLPAFELAVDPHALVVERSGESTLSTEQASSAVVVRAGYSVRPARPRSSGPPLAVGDLAFDARLLAEFGSPPRHWWLTPWYAWRVIRRRRELLRALAGRRAEASRAASEAEDGLVAFGARARETAEKHPSYALAVEELAQAEERLRSRDRVLAAEQDAQNARLAQIDARLSRLEQHLAQVQLEERGAAGELAATQAALAREEAKLKRAELELRSARQRSDNDEAKG